MILPFYQTIPGFFDYENLYDEIVAGVADKAHFVEIGALFGKSTCYLAQRIRDAGKQVQLDVVDHWRGIPPTPPFPGLVAAAGGDPYNVFLHNLQQAGLIDLIRPVRMQSAEAAALYPDNSLDFVFIDADHSYQAVTQDISNWWPKVKAGGVLAGHDYWMDEVHRAVQENFGDDKFYPAVNWLIHK